MTWMDCASMLGQAGIKPPEDWHLTGKLNEGCLDMELGILGVSCCMTEKSCKTVCTNIERRISVRGAGDRVRVRRRQLQRQVHQQVQGGEGQRGRGRQSDGRRHADRGSDGEVRRGVSCDDK